MSERWDITYAPPRDELGVDSNIVPLDKTHKATIADESSDTAREAIDAMLVEDTHRHLGHLTPRERTVIELGLGMRLKENGDPLPRLSHREIGNMLNLSGTRIQQIESTAMRKLRRSEGVGALGDYVKPPKEEPQPQSKRAEIASKIAKERYPVIVDAIALSLVKKFSPDELRALLLDLRRGKKKIQEWFLDEFDRKLDFGLLREAGISDRIISDLEQVERAGNRPPRFFVEDVANAVDGAVVDLTDPNRSLKEEERQAAAVWGQYYKDFREFTLVGYDNISQRV